MKPHVSGITIKSLPATYSRSPLDSTTTLLPDMRIFPVLSAVIDSVGFERAKELLIYYFKTSKSGHPLNFFFYNFDKIDYLKVEIEKDILNRRALREATKKMVEGGAE